MGSIREGGKQDEAEEEPVKTIKEKCADCLKGPNLIKSLVVLVCTGIVAQQLWVCIIKLVDVPVTTYVHFDFNKTLKYPSVTFCRVPAYKFEKLMEYGIRAPHPRWTAAWMRFNFSSVTLDKLWKDITYEEEEVFAQFGLNGEMHNVEVRTTLGFMNGRCYTLVPKVLVTHASRNTGYSITLQHSKNIEVSDSIYPPGYHVYVHYTEEPFTEVNVYNGGVVDYFYINTGETMDVKLQVSEYNMISSPDDLCNSDSNYSANNCTSQHVCNLVGANVGCSGPWMISDLPPCSTYSEMRTLISNYTQLYDKDNNANCPRYCRAFMYNAFVTERQRQCTWNPMLQMWSLTTGDAEAQAQLFMHFNSMLVSVYEERYNYDWNLFIADLGGSVGFLLGLSVIGLISFVGKMWYTIIAPFFKTSKLKTPSVTSSTVTTRVENVDTENNVNVSDKEYFKKCNEWQMEILKE